MIPVLDQTDGGTNYFKYETNTKKDDSKVEKDYTKEEWEVL